MMNKKGVPDAPSDILGADWFEKCAKYLNDSILITEAEPIALPGPRIIWANDVFYKLTGYLPEDIIGKTPRILQGPLTSKSELNKLRTALENWQACKVEVLNYKKDGSTFWNEFQITPIANEKGWYTHWISVQRDVTDRKRLELTIIQNEERYAYAIKGGNVGVWDWQVGSASLYLSPIWKTMLGYAEDEELDSVNDGVDMIHPLDRERVQGHLFDFIDGVSRSYDTEFRIKHKSGHYVHIQSHAAAVKNETGQIVRVVGTHVDISKRKRAEEKLNYQSSHDELTGLVNRREFERRAQELLVELQDKQTEHVLCYIDLDQFKVVNDTCGHAAGDELLRQLGIVLKRVIRNGDTLARLGGDEFGVLIRDCSVDDALIIGSTIKDIIEEHQFIYEDQSFRVSASIGLVPIIDAETTLSRILKYADAACYLAKDYGRNRIHIYSENDEELSQRHGEMQWVNRIQKALSEDRFCLYAQRIRALKHNDKVHYELLVRMQDVDGEIIPPGAFLPAAERYNLSVQIDKWVIQNAFTLVSLHRSALNKIDFVSINLSGHSLTDESVLVFIISKFDEYKLDGQKFCFEITETAAISNIVMAENFILELKKLGCLFALDDFGSGLSSFGYLKSLPIDFLKIDGMFIKDMVEDKIDYAMVKAIQEISQVMKMQTIAEFVENDGIYNMLGDLGVDFAQGFGVHEPQSFKEILDKLDASKH